MRLIRLFAAAISALAATASTAAQPPACTPFDMTDANAELVEVGRFLFYDPILSGGRDVACATCHHPDFATADGVALSFGDGAVGFGLGRRPVASNMPEQRIPRNAPALFNLGAAEFRVMFHDGRLEDMADRRRIPFGDGVIDSELPILAAQALLPLMSPDEMAGHYGESDVSTAVRQGDFNAAWEILAARVFAIPDYADAFTKLGYREGITPIGRALGAFMAFEWRADNSPFDRLICKDEPLYLRAAKGLELFYGKAGCADCHSGRFQTDHDFHAIAMPQIGPGKAERFESHARDTGRLKVTGNVEDAYKFRTPSLRNVALTAPYGHAGGYDSLDAAIRHHLDPVKALANYDPAKALLPAFSKAEDFRVLNDPDEMARIIAANELTPQTLSDAEVGFLIAFLNALTDENGATGRLGRPETVPSGLRVP